MLKKTSKKNLRWEEGHYIYCMRNKVDLDFDSFFKELRSDNSTIDYIEFADICDEIVKFDLSLQDESFGIPINLSSEERHLLLLKFGADI